MFRAWVKIERKRAKYAQRAISIVRGQLGNRMCTAPLPSPDLVSRGSPRVAFEYALSRVGVLQVTDAERSKNLVNFRLNTVHEPGVIHQRLSGKPFRGIVKMCYGTVTFAEPRIVGRDRTAHVAPELGPRRSSIVVWRRSQLLGLSWKSAIAHVGRAA